MAFINWNRVCLCILSSGFLTRMDVGFCQSFSASIKMIMRFLPLLLLIRLITFIDLHTLQHPWICWIKPTCPWCMILLMIWCVLLASIMLRTFALYSLERLACSYNFLVESLSGLKIRIVLACSNDFESTLCLLIALKMLKSIGVRKSLKLL